MLVRILVSYAAALGLLGCESNGVTGPSPARVPLNQPFQLELGKAAIVESADLRVRFEAVPADSRCPINAICVWAGDATVQLSALRLGHAQALIELHTTPGGPGIPPDSNQATYATFRIRLLTLVPGRQEPQRDPLKYVTTLVVSRL